MPCTGRLCRTQFKNVHWLVPCSRRFYRHNMPCSMGDLLVRPLGCRNRVGTRSGDAQPRWPPAIEADQNNELSVVIGHPEFLIRLKLPMKSRETLIVGVVHNRPFVCGWIVGDREGGHNGYGLALQGLQLWSGTLELRPSNGPFNSVSFSSPFAYSAKCWRLSLPLVTRSWVRAKKLDRASTH